MKNARPEVIVCSCSRYAALASRVSALAPLLLGSLGCDGADRMELTARSSALDAGSVVDAGSDGAATDAEAEPAASDVEATESVETAT